MKDWKDEFKKKTDDFVVGETEPCNYDIPRNIYMDCYLQDELIRVLEPIIEQEREKARKGGYAEGVNDAIKLAKAIGIKDLEEYIIKLKE